MPLWKRLNQSGVFMYPEGGMYVVAIIIGPSVVGTLIASMSDSKPSSVEC